MLVPEIVTGPTLPSEALLASTSVRDSDAPLHALGIAPSAILVTTPAVAVQEMVIPESEPHELTVALAPTTFFDVAVVLLATALPGTASTSPTANANAGARRMVA
jgi:hypothetical protein